VTEAYLRSSLQISEGISPDSRGEQNWYGSSPMGSQQKLVQDLVNGWPMIKANPATFIAIVVAIAFVEWVILHFWYRGRLSSKDAQIELQDRQLADYRDKLHVATPGEAKQRIDALEERLRRFEPRQLTDDQRKILIERARVYEHHELTIVVETGSDCSTYAAGFEATLREAGWDVHNWTIVNPPRRPRFGIAVQVPDLNNIPKEAELLRTALVAAYVDIELMHMEDFPVRTSIQLLITAGAS